MPRRRKPASAPPELTPQELAFMQILWDRGDATAAEVREALEPATSLADTTVHTVLGNLRRKGFIKPIPTVERAMRFAPAVPREQVARGSVRSLLQQFFDGSPRRLLAHLIRDEKLDEAELAELRRLLREAKKEDKP